MEFTFPPLPFPPPDPRCFLPLSPQKYFQNTEGSTAAGGHEAQGMPWAWRFNHGKVEYNSK